jgi:hypothetical protein
MFEQRWEGMDWIFLAQRMDKWWVLEQDVEPANAVRLLGGIS